MQKIDLNNYEIFVLDYHEGKLSKALTKELRNFSILHPELQIDLDSPLPELKSSKEHFPDKPALHREFSKDEDQILSYLENTLSQKERTEVENRLHVDPMFKKEFQSFEKTLLSTDLALVYPGIQDLHKTEEDVILIHPALRYLENDLSEEERLEFEKELLTHADFKNEYAAYLNTRLVAEKDIHFPDKQSLYKKNKVLVLFSSRNYYAAAAVILLLISLVPLIRSIYPSHSQNKNVVASKQISKDSQQYPGQVEEKDQAQALPSAPVTQSQQVLAKTDLPKNKNRQSEEKAEAGQVLAFQDSLKGVNPVEHSATNDLLATNTVTGTGAIEEHYEKLDFSHMIPFEEEEEESVTTTQKPAKGFWQKATRIAKQINKLGVKSVDGDEINNSHFLISFNAMSIEKK